MKRHCRGKNFRPLQLLAVRALIGCGALAFAVRAYNRPTEIPLAVITRPAVADEVSASPAVTALPPDSSPGEIDGAYVRIRPYGFDPKEVTGRAGHFFLAVDNRSGLDEVDLRLDREAGGRLPQVQVPLHRPDWRGRFELPPGRYLLTETNHPDWVCSITITPR